MLSEHQILELIHVPKTISSRNPTSGYRESDGHSRGAIELYSNIDESQRFSVFIRRSQVFIENYSIGLRYRPVDNSVGLVTLVRYNGSHGEYSLASDGHFAQSHIHYLTSDELNAGHMQPQEARRESTSRYETYEEALNTFLQDIGASNTGLYFPELTQLRLFDVS